MKPNQESSLPWSEWKEAEKAELHSLMNERLESIVNSMTSTRTKPRNSVARKVIAANREIADLDLSVIPVLFGA
ncbi:hypothetical protein LPTSP4_33180 [Leptospira ryugenii]|uniref:Uncharacterized protein n=1 Tax=Leptospira ryugenii TaxID=1917863 RepID=A0A2P2E4H1_9LEPT|nr:hypothetical protein [Leptospira ryugenii]GBF51780.1 hypothetical protein LPTSP4_33180 [Leptospira ryugenii]